VHSRRNKYVYTNIQIHKTHTIVTYHTQILGLQVQMEGMLLPGTEMIEMAICKVRNLMTSHFEVAQEEPAWDRIDGMVMRTVGDQQELVEVVAWKSKVWW
jgi:hypothetical protein